MAALAVTPSFCCRANRSLEWKLATGSGYLYWSWCPEVDTS